MGNRGRLRLVKDDPSPEDTSLPERGASQPLSWRVSLAIWCLMAALAWAVVAAMLHFL